MHLYRGEGIARLLVLRCSDNSQEIRDDRPTTACFGVSLLLVGVVTSEIIKPHVTTQQHRCDDLPSTGCASENRLRAADSVSSSALTALTCEVSGRWLSAGNWVGGTWDEDLSRGQESEAGKGPDSIGTTGRAVSDPRMSLLETGGDITASDSIVTEDRLGEMET